MLSYCAPVYDDNTFCILNKQQWDDVMREAYKDVTYGPRLMPIDVIETTPKNNVLYEKDKFEIVF